MLPEPGKATCCVPLALVLREWCVGGVCVELSCVRILRSAWALSTPAERQLNDIMKVFSTCLAVVHVGEVCMVQSCLRIVTHLTCTVACENTC
jgi:hypothetical protein